MSTPIPHAVPEISPETVWLAMQHTPWPWRVIDVREPSEWQREHLLGAVHIPLGAIPDQIPHQFPDGDTPLVLYCQAGRRSAMAVAALQQVGYHQVVSLADGIQGWIMRGYPVERTGDPTPHDR